MSRRPATRGRWSSGYNFNLRYELCRLCGATALANGHRFRIWFYLPCRREVGVANDRLGGYVIPIGRRSLHAGHWVRSGAPVHGREIRRYEADLTVLIGPGSGPPRSPRDARYGRPRDGLFHDA